MRRFKNVLVCIDDDAADLALERGATLALRAGASLKLLEVIHDVSASRPKICKRRALPRQSPRVDDRLEQLTMPLRGHSIRIATEVRRGPPAIEIAREVRTGCHDLVVRVNHDRRRLLFRETPTIELARLCPCPLWVISPSGVPGRENLLAAVHLHDPDEDLDVEVVETALAIAWLLDRRLHVVHAWDAPGARILAPRTSAEYLALYVKETMQQHREQLDRLMRRYAAAIPRDRIHLCKGRPTEVIPRVAAALAADPIVMGTAARRGVWGWLAGNTAERIVRQSDHSAVIVKSQSPGGT